MKKILYILATALVIAGIFLIPRIIKVKVICKSQFGECPSPVLSFLNSLTGKSLAGAKNSLQKYLKSNYLVSNYSFQYKIPDILHLDILVKKPLIAFKSVTSDKYALVDKKGDVLSLSTDSPLPTISIQSDLPLPGKNVGSTNFFALELTNGIFQMYQSGKFSVQDGSLLVELPGQMRVTFPLEGDADSLLGTLRLVYSKVKEDVNLSKYSQIDLRFKNPVLK